MISALKLTSWRDCAAIALIIAVLVLFAVGASQMLGPFNDESRSVTSLSPTALPYYALRTTMRMLAALLASLVFTFT